MGLPNARKTPLPTPERLRECLAYDGTHLIWKVRTSNRTFVGRRVTSTTAQGYVQVRLDGHVMLAHRVIWAIVHGEWPAVYVDHSNGDRTDNRVENLRLATQTENNANSRLRRDSSIGLKGVTRGKKRFVGQICCNGERIHLGTFDTPEAAHEAYKAKGAEIFGEFMRV
jgi:hypothetical protein